MSIPGYEFRMKSEIDFAVYKLSAFARSAAEADNAALSLSAQREDVPFTDRSIALVTDLIVEGNRACFHLAGCLAAGEIKQAADHRIKPQTLHGKALWLHPALRIRYLVE